MSQQTGTSPVHFQRYNSPRDRVFTLNDIHHSPVTSKSPTRTNQETLNVPKRVEFLRNTGTFGNSIDSEHQKLEEKKIYRATPQRFNYENLSPGRAEEDLVYSEGPVTKRFIGHVHGNPRIKFDLRRKNLNVAEFRSKLPGDDDETPVDISDKENVAIPNVEKLISSHRDYVKQLPTVVERHEVLELQIEKTPMIKYKGAGESQSLMNKEKEKAQDKNIEELRNLLEKQEKKLKEAEEKIRSLEQKEIESKIVKEEEIERHIEVFKKSVEVNLENLFGKIRLMKNVLSMNQVHIESIVQKWNIYEVRTKGIEEEDKVNKFTKEFKKEIEDLSKLSDQNKVYMEDFSKIGSDTMTKSLFEVLKRDFEFPREDVRNFKESEVEKMLREKIEVFIEEGEMREKRFKRINQRIMELEELLRNQEGFSNTTQKMIELEKKLTLTQEENENLESEYNKLKREKEKINQDLLKVSSEFKSLKNKDSFTGDLGDFEQNMPVSIREYVKRIESELLKTKADLMKIGNEKEMFESLNKQYELMSEKLMKNNEKFKSENKELESEVQRLNNELKNSSKMNTDQNDFQERLWKNEKQELELTIKKLETEIDSHKLSKISTEKETNEIIGQLSKELGSAKEAVKNAQASEEAAKMQLLYNVQTQGGKEEEKNSKIKEAVEQLSLIILSKDKSVAMSDDTKRFVQEVFGEKMSGLIETYEQRITSLQENEKKFYDILKVELDTHFDTLKNFKKCSEPLFELIAVLDKVKPSELGQSQLGKYAQRLKKRRQELIDTIKEVQENIDRLKKRYQSIVNPGSISDLDVSTQPLYKPLDARTKIHENDELNISREENDVLKKELELMSQKINNLKFQNEDLVRQVEMVTNKLEEAQSLRLTTMSSPKDTIDRKTFYLKSPNRETLASMSNPFGTNKHRTEESELGGSPSVKGFSDRGNLRQDIESTKGSILFGKTANMNIADTREMMLMQAVVIEDLLRMQNNI